jgi:hypothetical protein
VSSRRTRHGTPRSDGRGLERARKSALRTHPPRSPRMQRARDERRRRREAPSPGSRSPPSARRAQEAKLFSPYPTPTLVNLLGPRPPVAPGAVQDGRFPLSSLPTRSRGQRSQRNTKQTEGHLLTPQRGMARYTPDLRWRKPRVSTVGSDLNVPWGVGGAPARQLAHSLDPETIASRDVSGVGVSARVVVAS